MDGHLHSWLRPNLSNNSIISTETDKNEVMQWPSLIIIFIFSLQGNICQSRAVQAWCQGLQGLTTYLMLTTYSWMLCEGAYLRFILVFDEHITTSRLLKIWIYIMDYFLLIFNLFEISNSYCETNLRRIFLLNYINLYHWKFVEPSWGDISFRRIMIYMNRSKAK